MQDTFCLDLPAFIASGSRDQAEEEQGQAEAFAVWAAGAAAPCGKKSAATCAEDSRCQLGSAAVAAALALAALAS